MNIELLTKDDLIRLERKLESIEQRLLLEKPAATGLPRRLTLEEVLSKLQVSDRIAFYRRRDKLMKFGMFKEGKKYFMFEDDFERYMRSLRDEVLKIQNPES